jgi:hypothetical protein
MANGGSAYTTLMEDTYYVNSVTQKAEYSIHERGLVNSEYSITLDREWREEGEVLCDSGSDEWFLSAEREFKELYRFHSITQTSARRVS